MIRNESLDEKRGKHANKFKIDKKVWIHLIEMLKEFPSNKSHYRAEHSKLEYFENTELNIRQVYQLFQDYFLKKEHYNLKMSLSYFAKYFNYNCPYPFAPPKTDICDKCFNLKNNRDNLDENEKKDIEDHLDLYEKYKFLRKKFLEHKENLNIEFDYAANEPFPKLPRSDFYYKRFLSLYLFNINYLSIDESILYYFFRRGIYQRSQKRNKFSL